MKINYTNKVTVNSLPNVSVERKFTSDDANEIKTKHNSLVDYAINLNSRVTTETNNLSSRINNNLNAINNINSVNSQQNTNISNNQSSISSLRNTISSLENRIRTLENRPSSGFRIRRRTITPRSVTWKKTHFIEIGIRLNFRKALYVWCAQIDNWIPSDINRDDIVTFQVFVLRDWNNYDAWQQVITTTPSDGLNFTNIIPLTVFGPNNGNDDWELLKSKIRISIVYIERY